MNCLQAIKSIAFQLLFFTFIIAINAQTPTIHNDVFWNTTTGQPIYSQGGGVFRFTDPLTGVMKYYWYGVHYKEAETYRAAPSITQTKTRLKPSPATAPPMR